MQCISSRKLDLECDPDLWMSCLNKKRFPRSANLIQDVKVFRCKCATFTPYLLHPQNKELQGALVTCGAYLVIVPRETEIIEAVVDNWIVYILKAK